MSEDDFFPLRALRLKQGVSVREVARVLGVSHAYVSKVERELIAFFHVRHWHKLAEALDVDEVRIAQLWYNRRVVELHRELDAAREEFQRLIIELGREDELDRMEGEP